MGQLSPMIAIVVTVPLAAAMSVLIHILFWATSSSTLQILCYCALVVIIIGYIAGICTQ